MRSILILLVAMGFINALSNGILPSVSSYACLPYGRNIYHLTLTLSAIANPIFCFLYYYVPSKSVLNTIALTMIYTVTSAYVVGVAASSPCPILQDSSSGGIIMLLVFVSGVCICSYVKTAIGSILRDVSHQALVWSGASILRMLDRRLGTDTFQQ